MLADAGPVGVLGLTAVSLRLLASLAPSGLSRAVEVVYAPAMDYLSAAVSARAAPFQALGEAMCGVLVVAQMRRKKICCARRCRSSRGRRR